MRKVPSLLEMELLPLMVKARNGREIAKLYASRHGNEISLGSLYTTLRRMRDQGLISIDPGQGDARRRTFKITGTGAAIMNRGERIYFHIANEARQARLAGSE